MGSTFCVAYHSTTVGRKSRAASGPFNSRHEAWVEADRLNKTEPMGGFWSVHPCSSIERVLAASRANPWQADTSAPKGGAALITAFAILGGFGLLLWGAKASASKKTPEPAPVPPIKPVSLPDVTLRVYRRHIENLDTQAMKCSEPVLVFEGSAARAQELAWQLTTRAPVGAAGDVAVAVPVGYVVTSGCNWRRVCLADGSCMGVVGLS